MKVMTWNVQWCRGVDQKVDPQRIVDAAKSIADFDVLCLQEIADNFPAPRLAGNDDRDQFALLAKLLPGYEAVAGVAVDQPGDDGRRRRFGNMILSRLPVKQVYRFLLPHPADPAVPFMPRMALEAVIGAPFGDLRVITTHLEWYSLRQRSAQVDAIRRIYAEGYAHARDGQSPSGIEYGPFQMFRRPKATVVTGDFNMEYDSPQHAQMIQPIGEDTPPLRNAWDLVHPGVPYPGTFCVYHKMYGPGSPPMHCDFFFVSEEVVPRVVDVRVDGETQASDHQPVVLTLGN